MGQRFFILTGLQTSASQALIIPIPPSRVARINVGYTVVSGTPTVKVTIRNLATATVGSELYTDRAIGAGYLGGSYEIGGACGYYQVYISVTGTSPIISLWVWVDVV